MGRVRRALLHFVLVAAALEAILFCWGTATKGALPGSRPILFSVAVSLILASWPAASRYRRMAREGIAIKLRATVLQAAVPAFAGPLGAAIADLAWSDMDQAHAFEIWEFVGFGVLMMTAAMVGFFRRDVTLTPTALVVRALGTQVIDWRDVVEVVARKKRGGKTVAVVVYDVHGQQTRLPVPLSFLDRDFDHKVQLIRDCWLGRHDWSSLSRQAGGRVRPGAG